MIFVNLAEFKYLESKGELIKYLRYWNHPSKYSEPIMLMPERKRVGTGSVELRCIVQGNRHVDVLNKYVDKTPYKDAYDWYNNLKNLYNGNDPYNGYLLLIKLDKIVISIPEKHPSCHGCAIVDKCSKYLTLEDNNFCNERIMRAEIENPTVMAMRYRDFIKNIINELDKQRDIDDRNTIIINLNGIISDMRRFLND